MIGTPAWRSLFAVDPGAFDAARRRDPVGDAVHTLAAMIFFATIVIGTAPKDYALALLCLVAAWRARITWRTYLQIRIDVVWIFLLAWGGWTLLSLLWSPDSRNGWDELGAFRYLLLPLVLWPIVGRAAWMIAALLAGVLVLNALQLAEHLHLFGWKPRPFGRLSGPGLHPIQTATVCAMAVCWHLSALAWSRRERWVTAIAGLAAAAGMIFAGSRGPWIAAALMVPPAAVVNAWRVRVPRRAWAIGAVAALLALGAGWWLGGDMIARRVAQARADMEDARAGDLESHVGLRFAHAQAAWSMFLDAPLAGVGAGGFPVVANEGPHADLVPDDGHAHNSYLHVLASTGLIGGALMLGVLATGVVRCARDRTNHPYAGGMVFALGVWIIGAAFDAYHLSGMLFALLAAMLIITSPRRP